MLAERGFDPRTSGLWAQHASTAPLCSGEENSFRLVVDMPPGNIENYPIKRPYLYTIQFKIENFFL